MPQCTNDELKTLHQKQLEILVEFARVCEANAITFYLAYGTCIGAMRHKGFIPWDHDIDVLIYYKDLKRLYELREQFESPFSLQTHELEPQSGSISARLCNSNTTYICDEQDAKKDINHGIFIDVYPLFYVPNNWIKKKISIARSFVLRILVAQDVPRNHGAIARMIARIPLVLFQGKKREAIVKHILWKMGSEDKQNYVATYFGLDIRLFSIIAYESSWFATPVYGEFENLRMPLPTEADLYLKKRYGNYMELPPESEQNKGASYLYLDFNHGFDEYRKNVI